MKRISAKMIIREIEDRIKIAKALEEEYREKEGKEGSTTIHYKTNREALEMLIEEINSWKE